MEKGQKYFFSNQNIQMCIIKFDLSFNVRYHDRSFLTVH
jgi:hypothetical protein